VTDGSFPADESYPAEFVVGVTSTGAGADVAGAGARVPDCVRIGGREVGSELGEAGPFISEAGARLTVVTFPGGPTGGAAAPPTVTVSASGLPALSIGAVAVDGTV
jgi:hypothetical protein